MPSSNKRPNAERKTAEQGNSSDFLKREGSFGIRGRFIVHVLSESLIFRRNLCVTSFLEEEIMFEERLCLSSSR